MIIPATVQMVVKNEDRFIWYALNSLLPYVKNIIITDTGSTDKTIPIIQNISNSIDKGKIVLMHEKISLPRHLSQVRQHQLNNVHTDWIWIVDGDEVYTRELINEIGQLIKENGREIEGIVVGRYDLLGDIYHYQDDTAGYYNLFGRRGHFALRLINKRNVTGLHVEGVYPFEGFYDNKGTEIIHHNLHRFIFTKEKIFHAMYLKRSTIGANLSNVFHRKKRKIEVGVKMNKNEIPEVFFAKLPQFVPNVSVKRSLSYEICASVITPIKKVKRYILNPRTSF